MDRRQKKSRDAIFRAFQKLLEKKHYEAITVQEIIDEADVGRSTFYAHFETKSALLKEMCTVIFEHIFSYELHTEESHDFSDVKQGLEPQLTHLLYHLRDNKGDIIGLFTGDNNDIFLRYFREYLEKIFLHFPNSMKDDVPKAFALNHLSGSFAEAVRWWIQAGMKESPEEISSYYLRVIGCLDESDG